MAKSYDYIIELKKTSHFLADSISRFMLMIAIAFFGYTLYLLYRVSGLFSGFGLLLSVLIAGMIYWWIYCTLQQKGGRPVFYRLGLLMGMIGWMALARTNSFPMFYWIAAFYFIAVLLEKQVKFPREIAFDNTGIVINSLPAKFYQWSQVSNVILRDGMLTVDFENNKMIQQETQSDTTPVEEKEFNDFCRTRLIVAMQKV